MAREPLKVLTESMFYVLLSLLRQERCGADVMAWVAEATPSRTGAGPCSGRSSPACASAWPMASGRSWRRSGCCRG